MEKQSIFIDQKKLDSAQTFEELADIGLSMLKQISLSGKPIVQICGPISTGGFGNHKKNLAYLEKAIEVANKKGLQVFDQTPFDDAMAKLSEKYAKTEGYTLPILETFYKKIFKSGLITKVIFLPDWQSSKGATWERNVASQFHMKVEDYPKEWLAKIKNV